MKLEHRYVRIGKNSICRVQYYGWVQASTGGVGMYLPRVRVGDYCSEDSEDGTATEWGMEQWVGRR